MKIGITGTRKGMSGAQKVAFVTFLINNEITEQVDGCCIGVDAESFEIAKRWGIKTIGRPGHSKRNPNELSNRDNRERDVMHESKPFFERNRDIVDGCEMLVAMPYELGTGGGTNYTINLQGRSEGRC